MGVNDPRMVRPWARGAVLLPTGAEAAAFDRAAIDDLGVPESTLMESAGRAVADLVERLRPRGGILALVGAGNNGGDALVAARTLRARGRRVHVLLAADRAADDPLLHGWPMPVSVDVETTDDELTRLIERADVVLDGLLGTGIRGAPRDRQARLIRLLNGGPEVFVVAMDVPSGADADTGAVAGEVVRADVTVAFGWPKLGSLLQPARAVVGRLVAVEIGFPPAPEGWARLLTPAWATGRRPVREPDTHKNRVGALLLVAGRKGMAGAAVLAGRAALRSGAGFVRVASHAENREILQRTLPDAPFVSLADREALQAALDASTAVAAGPGLGTDALAEEALASLLEAGRRPMVLDADALNLLAGSRPCSLPEAASKGGLVVTPHPGEMARLTGRGADEIQGDRPGAARSLASSAGCVVLLKGAPSLVASPDGSLDVSGVGGSELAVAGMGDVLTGVLGSLLAQGLDPADAAGVALVVSGLAARRTGMGPGMAAGDVPEALPGAMAGLGPGDSDLALPAVSLDLDAAS